MVGSFRVVRLELPPLGLSVASPCCIPCFFFFFLFLSPPPSVGAGGQAGGRAAAASASPPWSPKLPNLHVQIGLWSWGGGDPVFTSLFCVCVCTCVRVRACVCVCVSACVRVHLLLFVPTHMFLVHQLLLDRLTPPHPPAGLCSSSSPPRTLPGRWRPQQNTEQCPQHARHAGE